MMLDFDNACANATILRMRYPSAANQRESGRSLHGFFRCLVDWLSFLYRFWAQFPRAPFRATTVPYSRHLVRSARGLPYKVRDGGLRVGRIRRWISADLP